MKLPFPAGNALNDNTRILVNEYAHFSASDFIIENVEVFITALLV
jgi:hypothetical protein